MFREIYLYLAEILLNNNIMKYISLKKAFVFGTLFFVACQSVDNELPIIEDKLPMSVVARIGEIPSARYTGDDVNSVEFTENDSIGIFVDKNLTSKWTHTSMIWTSEKIEYWPDKNAHQFEAFYPYNSAATYDNVPMPSLTKQDGSISGLSAIDFLVASTNQEYNEKGLVSFKGDDEKSFRHVSALIDLKINNDEDLVGATLTGISIEADDIVASSHYSFKERKVVIDTNTDTGDVLNLSLNETINNDLQYYIIVNEVKDTNSKVKLTVEYTKDGKTYIAETEDFSNNVFTSGTQHSFSLIIKNNAIIFTEAEIKKWESAPGDPQEIIINSQEKQS